MLESASVPSWALNRLFTNVHTTTCPESRIRHPYTHEKHGVHFRMSGNSCGALLGGNESSSAYPLMTLPVRRAVIRPSFASIADTLREEFANKGLRLYENIYIDDSYFGPHIFMRHLPSNYKYIHKVVHEIQK